MRLVSKYEITTVLPCIADTSKLRVIAKLDADIGEALPYLNATMKKVVFNPGGKTLTYKKEGMCFTFHENGITATKLRDLPHAHEELQAMMDHVNEVWERRAEITPSYERGVQLNALMLYKGLPATNCKECGEPSCLAFGNCHRSKRHVETVLQYAIAGQPSRKLQQCRTWSSEYFGIFGAQQFEAGPDSINAA